MASTRVRSSPSGRLVTVNLADLVRAEPRELSAYAPTTANPLSAPVELRPAGHEPGIYLVSFCPIVTVIGFATVTPSLSWSAPGAGLQIAQLGAFTTTALGTRVTPSVSVDSDGAQALVLICSAALPIIGAPVLDLLATANRLTIGGVP